MKKILANLFPFAFADLDPKVVRTWSSSELFTHTVSKNVDRELSKVQANNILLNMDFDEVEKAIFGVNNLDFVPHESKSHTAVVPAGYPFMDKVRTSTEERLSHKGFHALNLR